MNAYLLLLSVLLSVHLILASTPSRLERRNTWTPEPVESSTLTERNNFHGDWADAHDGHGRGHSHSKGGRKRGFRSRFGHRGRMKGEEHGANSAAGLGKHAVAETEGAKAKHADSASALGKDLKAKSFGFFDYRYKQPEYHVEQYYTDEKHGKKFGADHHHRAVNDHASDKHEASGWGKRGDGYVNDARGLYAKEARAGDRADWDIGQSRGYGHRGDRAYSRGGGSYSEDENSQTPAERWHQPVADDERWVPEERGDVTPSSWTARRPAERDGGEGGWKTQTQQPWTQATVRRAPSRREWTPRPRWNDHEEPEAAWEHRPSQRWDRNPQQSGNEQPEPWTQRPSWI